MIIRSEYTIESYGLGLEAIRINATIKNTTDENHNYTLVFATYDKKGDVVNVVKDNRNITAHQEYPLVARIPAGNTIEKPPGKSTLVPLADKRPAIHTGNVQSEFKVITEVY